MKLGRETFPGWNCRIQKAHLVYSSDIVKGLPEVFTLNQIIEWSDLLGANISNSHLSAQKVESGVSSWLGLFKVLIKFSFLVTGHNPAVWVEFNSSPSQPALASRQTVPIVCQDWGPCEPTNIPWKHTTLITLPLTGRWHVFNHVLIDVLNV